MRIRPPWSLLRLHRRSSNRNSPWLKLERSWRSKRLGRRAEGRHQHCRQPALNGAFPFAFLPAGPTVPLTFVFIDPATGARLAGPPIGAVRYEQSASPDIPGSFTLVGVSTDAT